MELAVQPRDVSKKNLRAMRGQGLIPVELYGRGIPNIHLAVDAKVFRKVFREAGENTVVTLVWGKEKRPALVHDLMRDYLTDEITHVDFYQVRMDEKIKAHVPLEFAGEAPAVKTHGGILNKSITEIEVEALPADLPRRLVVNVEGLTELHQSVYVKDLAIPKGARVHLDPETVIVTVMPPMKEEEIQPAPAPDVAAVKVESEEKKAEREKQKAEAEPEGA
jgi:large subunit ribosomal protein L25